MKMQWRLLTARLHHRAVCAMVANILGYEVSHNFPRCFLDLKVIERIQ